MARKFVLVFLYSCVMFVCFGVSQQAGAEETAQPKVSTFTLVDVRGTVSPGAPLVRVNALGTIRPTESPVAFSWFAQMGATVSLGEDSTVTALSAWGALQFGFNVTVKSNGVTMSNDLRGGARLAADGTWSFNPEHNFVLRGGRSALVFVTTPLATNQKFTFIQEGWTEHALVTGHVGIGPHYFLVAASDAPQAPNFRAGVRATFGGPAGQVYVMIDLTVAESPAVVPSLGARFIF